MRERERGRERERERVVAMSSVGVMRSAGASSTWSMGNKGARRTASAARTRPQRRRAVAMAALKGTLCEARRVIFCRHGA